MIKVKSIEIEFPVEMEIPYDWIVSLHRALEKMFEEYKLKNPGRTMWASEYGEKPNWSKTDAALLGKKCSPDAPISGEPSFDPSVYYIGISEREK